MRNGISQFLAFALLALLCLALIGFNGTSAEEYANSREMKAEHRLDDFSNHPEGRDHHIGHDSHGHSKGHQPSKTEDKNERQKPSHLAPKPRYRPSKSPSLPSKALHPASPYRPPSQSPPAYKPGSYTPLSYSPPSYGSVFHAPHAYKPAANSPTAYSVSTYKPPAYVSPAYSPPAYTSPSSTPTSYEFPPNTEASTNRAPTHSTPAYSSPAYNVASPSELEYPYKHRPGPSSGVSKGVSFDSDFPNFDDFVQQSIKFDQFKI